MPKTAHASETEQLAAHLRQIHGAFHETAGEGATQQVMSGFADAYRAWLEAVSAKPQTMLDLQGRYMQEQMKLWCRRCSRQANPTARRRPTSASPRPSGTSCRCSATSA